MFGIDSGSRFTLKLRRLRGRLGLGTPPVAVRMHWPWYWRAASIVIMSGISLALAGWIYSAGMRFAGFNQSASEKEITEMREQITQLKEELNVARKTGNISESHLRIESTSNERLSSQIKTLEEENARLQADLSMFEGLAGAKHESAGVAVSRLQVEPMGTGGQYRYRFFLSQLGEKKEKEFRGSIQMVATVQRGKETVMMQLPVLGDTASSQNSVSFRHFRRMEGTFKLATDAHLVRLEIHLVQDGVVKASQGVMF